MQKVKGKFQFKTVTAASKYPWDDILNGDINLLTKGEDYEVETDAMGPKIKTAARRRYKTVKISRRDNDGNMLEDQIIVQATTMTPEQVEAEDAKRAEEKAKRAEKGESEETEE